MNIIENLGNPDIEIFHLSGLRHKEIVLPKKWWKHNSVAMIGKLKNGTPIAIFSHAIIGYSIYNPKTDTTKKITAQIAEEIENRATAIFRTFPSKKLVFKDIVEFIHGEKLYKDIIIILLCSLIASIIQVIPAVLSEEIFNTIIPGNMRGMLFEIIVILIIFELVNIGFTIMANLGITRIGMKAGLAVSVALCDRLLYLKMPFFNKYTSGEILEKIKGIDRIKNIFIENNLKIIIFNMFVIVEIVILFKYCAEITPMVLLMFAGLIIIYAAAGLKKHKINLKLVDAQNKAATFTYQSIHAMHRIIVSGAQERAYNIWKIFEKNKHRLKSKIKKIDSALDSLCKVFKFFSTAVVYLLIINVEGVTIGAFIAYISAFFILQRSVFESLRVLDTLPELMSVYKNIDPILKSLPEYDTLKRVPADISGSIEFNHVSFRYGKLGRVIIDDVSFKVEEGESVGILGPSGSGKSTILKLLMGLYNATSGKIYYGGYDLETINLRYLRKKMSVVVQYGNLAVGDIYYNIAGNDKSVSTAEVYEILKNVGLEETVCALPDGLYTRLEECMLSPGEMQKLLVARAMARKSKFVFLDEATSHLDNESQNIIIESLKKISATKIIIAQRLETVRNCDRIITFENGEIINI
jgi:ATP-binding cassette subfamily C protein